MVPVIYFAGFFVYFITETKQTPEIAREAALWPIILVYFILKAGIALMNDVVRIILLIVGFEYKNTEVYKKISDWGYGGI